MKYFAWVRWRQSAITFMDRVQHAKFIINDCYFSLQNCTDPLEEEELKQQLREAVRRRDSNRRWFEAYMKIPFEETPAGQVWMYNRRLNGD